MANKELMITLGLDSSSYTQNVRKAKDLNKELDSSFNLLKSSSEKFEDTLSGLGKKQDYLANKMKVASQLTEVYAKRITETQTAVDKAKKDSETYAEKLEKLNAVKEKLSATSSAESKSYQACLQGIKSYTQLLDKANKAVTANEKRLSEARNGYNETQIAMQSLGREATLTAEKMSAMRVDENINKLSISVKDYQHEFELLRNSTNNFDNTMDGLSTTQNHYNQQIELTEKLMKAQSEEMKNSSKKIQYYEQEVREVSKELNEWQTILDQMNGTEDSFDYTRKHVEGLRAELSNVNKIVEFHQERMGSLDKEYKQNDVSLSRFNGTLNTTGDKIKDLRDKASVFEALSEKVDELANGSITKLEKEMSELDNEFKLATTLAKNYESTLGGLEIKQRYFNESLKLANSAFNEYSQDLINIKAKTSDLTKEQKDLENEIRSQIALLATLDGAEWDKQNEKLEELKKNYDSVNKNLEAHTKKLDQVERGYTESRQKVAGLKTEFESIQGQMDSLSKKRVFDDLDNKVKSITDKIKVLESQFKATESTMKNFSRTKEGLAAKTETYKAKIGALKDQLNILNTTLDKNGKELTNLKEEQDQVALSVNALRVKMLQMDKDSPQYAEALISLSKLEQSYEDVKNEANKFESANSRLQVEINETTSEINTLTRATNNLNKEFTAEKFERFGSTMQSVGNGISQVGQSLMGISMVLGGAQTAMVATGIGFTDSMSRVKAVTGATKEEFEMLEESSREMAKVTVFSASDCADALTFLGLAGYSASEAVETLPNILSLGQAAAIDLSVASDLATDSIASLGFVGADAVKALPDYLDKVAMASTKSNTSIEQMMQAYIKVGGQLDTMNIGLDTSASMLGVLANRGIKAESAGNSLNSILINMTKESGQSADAMQLLSDRLGYTNNLMFDSEGNMRNIEDCFLDMSKAMEGMTQQEKINIINMIGGKTQAKTLQKLMQGMITDTGELSSEYLELKKNIESAPDMNALEEMAKIMTDNLGGDVKILKSQIEESFLTIFDTLEPRLRDFVQNLTKKIEEFTEWFIKLDEPMQNFILGFSAFLVIAPPILMAIGAMASGIGAIAEVIGLCTKKFPGFKKEVKDADGKIVQLNKSTQKFTDSIPKMTEQIKNYGKSTSNFFKGLSKDVGGWASGLGSTVSGALSGLGSAIGGAISGAIAANAPAIWASISGVLSTLGGWIATGLGAIFSAAGLEIVAIAAAIAGAIYLIYKAAKYLYENWEDICKKIQEIWQGFLDWFSETGKFMKEKAKEIGEYLKEGLKAAFEFVKELPSKAKKLITTIFKGIMDSIAVAIGNTIGLFLTIGKEIYDILSGAFTSLDGVFKILEGIFTLNFEKIKEGIQQVFQGIFDIITDTLHNAWAFISGSIENFAKVFGVNLDGLTEKVEDWVIGLWNSFVEWRQKFYDSIIIWITGIGTKLSEWASTTWTNFTTWLGNLWTDLGNWFTNLFIQFPIWLAQVGTTLVNWCTETWTNFTTWLSQLRDNLAEWASITWTNFVAWLGNLWNSFTTWCSDMWSKLTEFLAKFAQDPIKYLKLFAVNIANGLKEAWNSFKTWCSDMIGKLLGWFSEFIQKTKEKLDEWAAKFQEIIPDIIEYFKELPGKIKDIGIDMIKNLYEGAKEGLANWGGKIKDSIGNIADGLWSKAAPANVNARVNYTQGDMPSLARIAPAEVDDYSIATVSNGFSGLGNIIGDMFKDAFSLDNYKTTGGFYNPNSVRVKANDGAKNSNNALLEALIQQNQLLMQMLTNSTIEVGVNVDGRTIAKASAKYMENEINTINKRKSRLGLSS